MTQKSSNQPDQERKDVNQNGGEPEVPPPPPAPSNPDHWYTDPKLPPEKA